MLLQFNNLNLITMWVAILWILVGAGLLALCLPIEFKDRDY